MEFLKWEDLVDTEQGQYKHVDVMQCTGHNPVHKVDSTK